MTDYYMKTQCSAKVKPFWKKLMKHNVIYIYYYNHSAFI